MIKYYLYKLHNYYKYTTSEIFFSDRKIRNVNEIINDMLTK